MAVELLKPVDEKGPDLGALLCMQGSMSEGEWRVRSDAAQVAANYLRCHPAVAEVRYPGLTSDSVYREASSTLRGGFGPLVWVRFLSGSGYFLFDASDAPSTEQVMALERLLRLNKPC